MYFCHSGEIWRDFPELVAGLLFAEGITKDASVGPQIAKFNAIAEARLATTSEGQLPEIQAWRRVFSSMGLKPTQYRCASESLLRRFRKEKSLPHVHPLIDLYNAISLAFAIPVAVFDVSKIAECIEVGYAAGSEVYLAFSGEVEKPEGSCSAVDESAKCLFGRPGSDPSRLDRRGSDARFGSYRHSEPYNRNCRRVQRHLVRHSKNQDTDPVLTTIRVLTRGHAADARRWHMQL